MEHSMGDSGQLRTALGPTTLGLLAWDIVRKHGEILALITAKHLLDATGRKRKGLNLDRDIAKAEQELTREHEQPDGGSRVRDRGRLVRPGRTPSTHSPSGSTVSATT